MEKHDVYRQILQLLHAGSFQGKFSPLVLDCWKYLNDELDVAEKTAKATGTEKTAKTAKKLEDNAAV